MKTDRRTYLSKMPQMILDVFGFKIPNYNKAKVMLTRSGQLVSVDPEKVKRKRRVTKTELKHWVSK